MTLLCDMSPVPVWASAMWRIKTGYSGIGITLNRLSDNVNNSFLFDANDELPLSAIDAFRQGEICRVVRRGEQMGQRDFVSIDAASRPKFGDLTIGSKRCIWLEGDCNTDVPASFTGQVYGLVSQDVTSLNVVAGNYTVMQAIQIHNSTYGTNTYRGCVFAATSAGGGPHSRVFSESNFASNPYPAGELGGYAIEAPGFRYAPIDSWMETTPIVLTTIMGPSGIFIGQNQDFRSSPQVLSSANVAQQFRLGHHDQSFPPTGITVNEAMGMSEVATLVWNQPLSLSQAANFASILYKSIPINSSHSHSNAPLVIMFNDSICAGYKGDDLRGWDKRTSAPMSTKVRVGNFARPGGSYMPGPDSPPGTPVQFGSYALGVMPHWAKQAIRQHKGKVHCVLTCPTNDFGIGQTPASVYSSGILGLISAIRALDPTVVFTVLTATVNTAAPSTDVSMVAVSQLIRDGAAANNYGVVDVRTDSVMSVPNAPAYKDGIHPTNFGWDRMATLIMPRINSWLTSLGITP